MPPEFNFNDYEAYRNPVLSVAEQRTMRLFDGNPLMGQQDLALGRAREQLKEFDMPGDVHDLDRFPGIDPQGKFSTVDLDFARREENIKGLLGGLDAARREYLSSVLDALQGKPQPDQEGHSIFGMDAAQVREVHNNMKSACADIRLYNRAARLCLVEEAANSLIQTGKGMEAAEEIAEYEQLLTGLEHVAGIKAGPMPEETHETLQRLMPNSSEIRLAQILSTPVKYTQPAHISCTFQNFDNVNAQRFLSQPANWGRPLADVPPDMGEDIHGERLVAEYAGGTVSMAIDSYFAPVERLHTNSLDPLEMNRGNLISVDGKTVRELMEVEYGRMHPYYDGFDRWYSDNLKTRGNEIVAAGLLAGKHVEAFLPGENGRIPEKPVQITRAGYEPSPMKPVTLNFFERFLNNIFGFFKEKAARAEESRRVLECRQRIQHMNQYHANEFLSVSDGAGRAAFWSRYEAAHGTLLHRADMGAFRLSRTAPASTCACLLAANGYSAEEIMDPAKLTLEKQAAANLYMYNAERGDNKWLGRTLLKGQKALIDQADAICNSASDLTKLDQHEKFPLLRAMSMVLLDSCQEKDFVLAEYKAAGEEVWDNDPRAREYSSREVITPNEKRELCNDYVNWIEARAGNIAACTDALSASHLAVAQLANPLDCRVTEAQINFFNVCKGEFYRDKMAASRQLDPARNFSERLDSTDVLTSSNAINASLVISAFAAAVENEPAVRKETGRQILNGEFFKKIHIEERRVGQVEVTAKTQQELQAEMKEQYKAPQAEAPQKPPTRAEVQAPKPQGPMMR